MSNNRFESVIKPTSEYRVELNRGQLHQFISLFIT